MKLTLNEEEAITKRILDLDSQGLPPTLRLVRDMANKLLSERQRDPVSEKWPTVMGQTSDITWSFPCDDSTVDHVTRPIETSSQ